MTSLSNFHPLGVILFLHSASPVLLSCINTKRYQQNKTTKRKEKKSFRTVCQLQTTKQFQKSFLYGLQILISVNETKATLDAEVDTNTEVQNNEKAYKKLKSKLMKKWL